MKPFFILLSIVLLLFSCESTEVNDPAIQADIDDFFFKAVDERVKEQDDGTYIIQGVTREETLTLKVSSIEEGVYNFGGESDNYASFENRNGDTYYTNPHGNGRVVISNYDSALGKLSGSFDFNAMISGIDTIVANNGIFFETPILELYEEVILDNGSTNAGTFVARVDGNPFNPYIVAAYRINNQIVILGETTNRKIVITVPINVMNGNTTIPEINFNMTYEDPEGVQEALDGNLIIVNHDTSMNKIQGTFYFQTYDRVVSLGQFNVIYE